MSAVRLIGPTERRDGAWFGYWSAFDAIANAFVPISSICDERGDWNEHVFLLRNRKYFDNFAGG